MLDIESFWLRDKEAYLFSSDGSSESEGNKAFNSSDELSVGAVDAGAADA